MGLRVLLAGFEVDPPVPKGIGEVRVDVVHRARTVEDAASAAEAVGADVVLGDAALPEIVRLEHSGAVALLRSETMHAFAHDLVETVLAVAAIRAFCVADA